MRRVLTPFEPLPCADRVAKRLQDRRDGAVQLGYMPAGASNGVDFSRGIRTYGDPGNPPILFLHGIRLGAAIWEPHAQALCDEFFVITPDLPGHGRLAHLPFETTLNDAFLTHIAATVTSRPPLIVGYSLGGYLAMRYASALPERTAGLLISGCSTEVIGGRALLYELGVAFASQFTPRRLQNFLALCFQLTLPTRVTEVVIPLPFNPRVFETSRSTIVNVRYSELLAGYGKPVLIVNGEYDALFRPDEEKFARATDANLIVVPGSDHAVPMRRPNEFSEYVRTFARAVFERAEESAPKDAASKDR